MAAREIPKTVDRHKHRKGMLRAVAYGSVIGIVCAKVQGSRSMSTDRNAGFPATRVLAFSEQLAQSRTSESPSVRAATAAAMGMTAPARLSADFRPRLRQTMYCSMCFSEFHWAGLNQAPCAGAAAMLIPEPFASSRGRTARSRREILRRAEHERKCCAGLPSPLLRR